MNNGILIRDVLMISLNQDAALRHVKGILAQLMANSPNVGRYEQWLSLKTGNGKLREVSFSLSVQNTTEDELKRASAELRRANAMLSAYMLEFGALPPFAQAGVDVALGEASND